MDAARVAGELMAQAEHDEDAAFNAQHALAREGERASARILAEGEQEQRKIAEEQARAARAEAEASRFDPEDDAPPIAQRPRSVPPVTRPVVADDSDDDDRPAHWLT